MENVEDLCTRKVFLRQDTIMFQQVTERKEWKFFSVLPKAAPGVTTKNSIGHKDSPPLGRREASRPKPFWPSDSPSFLGDRLEKRGSSRMADSLGETRC